jgi:hypothetical protein
MQKMILENGEYDLSKLFALIAELGESLNENRSLSVSLYAQANNVKVGVLWSVLLEAKERSRRKRFIRSRAMCYAGMASSDVSRLY